MNDNFTTLEQSEKLVKLGLNIETADMCYLSQTPHGKPIFFKRPGVKGDDTEQYYKTSLPCWSLGALLGLLRSYNDCNKLSIFTNRSQKWQITISYYDIVWKEHEEIDINLLEASYNTVVWLLENGYIKTEKK